MKAHYGQDIERTKIRRMALEVEQRAMEYAEVQRRDALERVEGEAKITGAPMRQVRWMCLFR